MSNLDPIVNDQVLSAFFSKRFRSVLSAKVTNKQFGYVMFNNFTEANQAVKEYNGKYLISKKIEVKHGNWASSQFEEGDRVSSYRQFSG